MSLWGQAEEFVELCHSWNAYQDPVTTLRSCFMCMINDKEAEKHTIINVHMIRVGCFGHRRHTESPQKLINETFFSNVTTLAFSHVRVCGRKMMKWPFFVTTHTSVYFITHIRTLKQRVLQCKMPRTIIYPMTPWGTRIKPHTYHTWLTHTL